MSDFKEKKQKFGKDVLRTFAFLILAFDFSYCQLCGGGGG
jgi:hypothetical protein